MLQTLCEYKLVYVIVVAIWILPILINIPKILESDVDFKPGPGNGSGYGYLCYSIKNGTIVVLTETQYILNLINDSIIFLIIVISSFVSWFRFKKEVDQHRTDAKNNDVKILALNICAKVEEQTMRIAVSIVCAYYVVVRLPLYIFGHPSMIGLIGHDSVWIAAGISIILYIMQFCTHFLIYAVIMLNFRKAYVDTLQVVFPCCFKCTKSNDTNTLDNTNVQM